MQVTDGNFNVTLGTVNSLANVNFNVAGLYLGVKIGSDDEMSPRVELTAAPYAFNSDNLGGISSSGFVQLGRGLQLDTSSSSSIAINKTSGTGDLIDLQRNGISMFLMGNDGSVLFSDSTGSDQLIATDATSGLVSVANDLVVYNVDGSITRNLGANRTATNNLDSGSQSQFLAVGTQTNNLIEVSNAGFAPTIDNVNGVHIDYSGGNAAVEGAGMRIDFTPGGTSGGEWGGLRIIANATGAASGVEEYGLKLEGPATPGVGNETAVKITSGWDIGIDVGSGGLQLAAQSEPATPAAGTLRVYAKSISGRMMLRQKGPSGVATPLQPSFFQNQIMIINAGQTATNIVSAIGGSVVNSATSTISHPTATETFGFMTLYTTGTTAGNEAGTIGATNQFIRGSTTGANGFFFSARVGVSDISSVRKYVGLTDQTTLATIMGSDNPAGNRVGFSFSTARGDTTWKFTTKNGSTESLVDTGVTVSVNKVYDMYFFVTPEGTVMNWRLDNVTDDTIQEGSTSSTLPTSNVAMRPAIGVETQSGGAATFRMQRIYIESDR